MTNTKLLVGSLSNDLFRVASLFSRGSVKAASRFLTEAKRWSGPLQQENVPPYIQQIALKVSDADLDVISNEDAENYLMYGVLLQNYALHS